MGLLERYERWVRSNAAAVVAAEGALSSLTWLVPDRFADSELTLEALNSVLGLLSMYHGRILGGPDSSDGGAPHPPGLPWPLWLGALHQVRLLGASADTRVYVRMPLTLHLRRALLSSWWRDAPARLPRLFWLGGLLPSMASPALRGPRYKRKSDTLQLFQPPAASTTALKSDKGCNQRTTCCRLTAYFYTSHTPCHGHARLSGRGHATCTV